MQPQLNQITDYGYFRIHECQIREWERVYPNLNVGGELEHMVQWLKANKRKANKKNWPKFIIGWLNREYSKVTCQAAAARSYARVGTYETQHASPERAEEILAMIEKQRGLR